MKQGALIRGFSHWFAPSCVLCDEVSDAAVSLCTACQQDLPWLLHACQRCSLPLDNTELAVCSKCQREPPISDSVICVLHYATPVDFLIKRMKFGHQLSYAKVLGYLLAQQLKQSNVLLPDAILPVPLHNARLRERGFNQTLEIYRELRRSLDIPLVKAVTRARSTQAQSLLSAEQRIDNIRDVFAVKAGASLPTHIAILDDVVTTGATTNELARILKAAGVTRVSVWAIARATPQE